MTESSSAASPEDAITLLMSDHREVERLYAEFQQAGFENAERRQELANDIIRELSVHAIVEEMYLYPLTAEAVANGEELAEHSLEEHQEIKVQLDELDAMEAANQGYDQKLGSVISTVSHHVEEEEGQLFPALRRAVDADRLQGAGEKMRRAKAVAPTRPHPTAPNTPPGNKILGPFAAIADKIRDTGRRFSSDS